VSRSSDPTSHASRSVGEEHGEQGESQSFLGLGRVSPNPCQTSEGAWGSGSGRGGRGLLLLAHGRSRSREGRPPSL